MTYSWSTVAAWESDNGNTAGSDGDPAIPFTPCSLPGGANFAESGAGIGTGTDDANFDGEYDAAGYYIVEVQCTANVHDSSTGAVIGTLSGVGYIGGTATASTLAAMLASAARPMDSMTSSPTGDKTDTIKVIPEQSGLTSVETSLAQAIASGDPEEVGAIVQAMGADDETETAIVDAYKEADMPKPGDMNTTDGKLNTATKTLHHLYKHIMKLMNEPNSPAASGWKTEIRAAFKNLGNIFKLKGR